MSGVTGSNRITRENFNKVLKIYEETILKTLPGFVRVETSGSFNSDKTKMDFGDIDLIVYFETDMNKRDLKKSIIEQLKKLPDDVIVPFQSEKYKGRKYYNSGEIVTISFPQPEGFVQIDNIFALTEQEMNFKKRFLDLPAEKQGLILGLTKIAPQIHKGYECEDGEELEYSLSSIELQLRAVKFNEQMKQVGKRILWRTKDWSVVEKVLSDYKIDKSFEDLIQQVENKGLSKRERSRIVGLFCSMVSVKSGEVGTPKGRKKEESIKKIQNLLDNQ